MICPLLNVKENLQTKCVWFWNILWGNAYKAFLILEEHWKRTAPVHSMYLKEWV